MRLETFQGRDIASVNLLARQAMGEDVMILETRAVSGRSRDIEIVAAPASELESLMRLLRSRRSAFRNGTRPRVVALVGPTGAGKTTTIAKLATNADAYGNTRVGLITLDTHRAAGFEQLQAYADAAGLPCAVAYDTNEASAAMRRMIDCDVILVDTAGRGPAASTAQNQARNLLASLRPDEVHLCVPATMRLDLIARVRESHKSLRPTHAILTKLDEVPSDLTLAELASRLNLPMQWVTNGQNVPADLLGAAKPILAPLGLIGAAA